MLFCAPNFPRKQAEEEEERKTHLGRPHGGLEGGEAVVEGAEDRNDVVRDRLALLERLSHQGNSLAQRIRGRRGHRHCCRASDRETLDEA